MVEYRLVHLVRFFKMLHQVQWKKPSIHDLLMGEFTLRPISEAHHQTNSPVAPHKPYRAIGKKAKPAVDVKTLPTEDVVPVEQMQTAVTRYVDGKRVQIV